MRRLLVLALLARAATAQPPDGLPRPSSATVSGVVRDSIARRPLADAVVQLVAADGLASAARTAIADSLGRFVIDSVPDGRYTLGFFHPILDSLGVEPPLRAVIVQGQVSVSVGLATPSPARMREALCGSGADASAVVVGVVRSGREGTPVSGATVSGEWVEYSFRSDGIIRRVPRLAVTTEESGWFVLCRVPSAGTMFLLGTRGADSTAQIELQVPQEGFLRRDLYLGSTSEATAGHLRGTVVTVEGNRPVAGALLQVVAGRPVRSNDRGEWSLVELPIGTRVLEIRAVGFYPERRPVDVVPGAGHLTVALRTFKAVLDTVRITAARIADRHNSGFVDRTRSGVGRFLTAEDVARRVAIVTSDLFRNFPGVRMERSGDGPENRILVRGMSDNWCEPTLFIDGVPVLSDVPLSAEDLNGMVIPREILGIEVYSATDVPPRFQRGLSGCGSIVVWTK